MSPGKRPLLVTTALEETWGTDEDLVFLGEWCKRYERRHVWGARQHQTARFHWDDRAKLAADYDQLQMLHGRLLQSLASSLNELHGVDHSVRYWQILLDPWLMAYVGIVFDRWECLRLAMEPSREMESVGIENLAAPPTPSTYLEFIVDAASSDEWNHALYRNIIESEYATRCPLRTVSGGGVASTVAAPRPYVRRRRGSVRRRVALAADRLLGRLGKSADVAFVESFFGTAALVRLNAALRQVPRWYLAEFDLGASVESAERADGQMRTALKVGLQPASPFERFVLRSIMSQLPRSVVEWFHKLRERARAVPIKARAIVTANAHWGNVLGKAWMAEQVERGVKLVVLEHGGSIPARRELFNFEEDIADVKGTWFTPYHPKHVRVPPSKLVSALPDSWRRPRARRARYCSVIANTCPRWVFRVNFYPMAAQWMGSVADVIRLHDGLDAGARKALRVKPIPRHVDVWNSRQRYADALGGDKVFGDDDLDAVFAASTLIICTYPETTFAEAMASGVPTIMLYPDGLYERHAVAQPLLNVLRDARIVIHDPEVAAAHVNAIWPDPVAWWNGPEVLAARLEFRRQAVDWTGDWVGDWRAFLSKVLA